jgi:septum formation protein
LSMLARRVVLASTSVYRAELLGRVLAQFELAAANIDETPIANESPRRTAIRLARDKAMAVSDRNPGTLVIGSDQVADLAGLALGKPGTLVRAQDQLMRCSGRVVDFHTTVCVLDGCGEEPVCHEAIDTTRVIFRELSEAEISRYLEVDQSLDCAGSFKVERLGIALFERIESSDPSALIGLPLIALCRLLRQCGLSLP